MKILILGAGRVGRSVAENLVSDANEISVIDNDPERIRTLQDRFDLMGLVGRLRHKPWKEPPHLPKAQTGQGKGRKSCFPDYRNPRSGHFRG